MIQSQTILHVSDNSGAKTAMCIKVLGGYRKRYARVGDVIVVTIKSLRSKNKSTSKIKKGAVCKAIVIRTKKNSILKDGSTVFFSGNSVSLITNQGTPLSTRVMGPVLNNFKRKKLFKFIQLAPGSV